MLQWLCIILPSACHYFYFQNSISMNSGCKMNCSFRSGFRYSITKAFCVAFLMTFFSVFDVPVFWPILLCYWIVLFILTMKRQIMHMIKYKYVPFSVGKQVRALQNFSHYHPFSLRLVSILKSFWKFGANWQLVTCWFSFFLQLKHNHLPPWLLTEVFWEEFCCK